MSRLGQGPEALLGAILVAAGAGVALVLVTRVRPVVFVVAALLLSVFSGHWDQLGAPFGVDHVVMAGGVLAAIYRAASRRHPERFTLQPVHLVLAAAALYGICSAVWAHTFTSSSHFYALLDGFGIMPFALFALAPVIFATARDRQLLLVALVVLGAYLGVTALGEIADVDALVFPRYITNPNLGIHLDRVRGPFLEASPMGFVLFACAVACAQLGLTRMGVKLRLVLGAIVILCVVGIFGTVTRHVWIGAALGLLVGMVVAPQLRRYTVPTVVGVAAVIGLALVLVPGLSTRASDRASSDRPVWDRLNSDRAALNMLKEKPLLGQGWGTFSTKGDNYYQIVSDYPLTHVDEVHNVFLSRFMELGAVGAGLWLVGLLMAAFQAIRGPTTPELQLWRIGFVTVFVCWLVTANFVPLDYALPNALLWVLAGVAAIPATSAVRVPARRPAAQLAVA